MKRAMVGILAVILLAAFASPVMAISSYFADLREVQGGAPNEDCGNVVVTTGGTLIAVIDLGANNSNCTPLSGSTTTFDVCRVVDGVVTFVGVQLLDDNPQDGRISALEGTKIGAFGSGEEFDFLQIRSDDTTDCTGTVQYKSGQGPRP